jgi:hypothetical protein
MLSTSSSVIKEVLDMRQMGSAMVLFFYFDFHDNTSWPEIDIRDVLEPLAIHNVPFS